jgi:hypothetical protein
VSLRDLESRKAEIEQELRRVQFELEERNTKERRSNAKEPPLHLLPGPVQTTARLPVAAKSAGSRSHKSDTTTGNHYR